ncbi:MAG: 50S ribosomal protein L1 [Calditrichaeota bacterium]|nr:50S ribosomal protein L1 [Candidatus Cloacimonadota bacterium]MCB1048070.1 50S ribosomal protein L1 [Calditrichota bacterium]MCB9472421.1 50S ribosomal protein L1 [Candidatus Delongbacteria bacterium]
MKRSKRFRAVHAKVDRLKHYSLNEACGLVRECASAKFDETVEVTMNLGVDPRHADQIVRGTVSLPHGTGKEIRVLVLAKSDKAKEATEAGADFAGLEDQIQKIKDGWLEFDSVIATPDVMGEVGKLGRVLGPRGLMPNPKVGTVTMDVAKAVREVKAGRIDFRVDKYGILHVGVGRVSFTADQLEENIDAFVRTVVRLKPSGAKGTYVKGISLASTMGPGIRVDRTEALARVGS